MQNKMGYYASILPLLLQLSYVFVTIPTIFASIASSYSCVLYYVSFVPRYWIANALSLNMTFSTIFCYIAWKQYYQYGSNAWEKLAKDGIQVILLAALCNICCCIIAVTQAIGDNSDLPLVADW
jgi:hypothetical protein